MTGPVRFAVMGSAVVALGVVSVVVGLNRHSGSGGSVFAIAGGLIIFFGVWVLVAATLHARPRRRLPDALRERLPFADGPRPVVATVELSDGRRVENVVILRGGYVARRYGQERIDARLVVAFTDVRIA